MSDSSTINDPHPRTKDIPTQVKDPELVSRRRMQIVNAAVRLFIEKGFHKTTTREIAQAAGISIGALYEYVTSKEDVLYLVCETIHAEVRQKVTEAMMRTPEGQNMLAEVLREFFLICHRMSDYVLMMYQETRTLPHPWQKRILENELNITGIFVEVLVRLVESGHLPYMDPKTVDLMAHNISVLGHTWSFRRWFLARHYSIEEYIKLQTDFILGKIQKFS